MSSNEISDQLLDDTNLTSMKEVGKKISIGNLAFPRIHWANRDFSEYKEAAWFYFFEEIFFISCMFLVRGIVDKTKDTTNSNVIPTRLQKVRLDSSNSPNETVRYKFNFNWVMIIDFILAIISFFIIITFFF